MQGKTIVITGGLGALGSAVAEAAAKRGASVALLDYAPTVPEGFAERLIADDPKTLQDIGAHFGVSRERLPELKPMDLSAPLQAQGADAAQLFASRCARQAGGKPLASARLLIARL